MGYQFNGIYRHSINAVPMDLHMAMGMFLIACDEFPPIALTNSLFHADCL